MKKPYNNFLMHQDIETSDIQVEDGQIKDSRTALAGMRGKYDL